jgi:ketosteroid isomerase-like protein
VWRGHSCPRVVQRAKLTVVEHAADSETPTRSTQAHARDAQTPAMITLSPDMAKSAAAAAREISMNRIIIAVLLLLLFAATSFAKNEKSANGANLLLQLEANFAADVAKHGHDAFLTYFAEDGVEIVDGGGINDKDAMRKQPPWPEGTTLTWTPVHAEMAASGDLGYTYGKYVYTAKNKEGKVVANYGKYTSIWKKQKDGQWKVVVDMGNSSPDPQTGK